MTSLCASIAAILAAVLASGALIAPSVAAADSPASLLYERSLMDRAGARCRLFTPDIAAALTAAVVQARGAALRSGARAETVRQIEGRAALRAYATPCASPDLALAAGRVRKAFDGYATLRTMSFPGAAFGWEADRKPWPLVQNGKVQPGPRWRLWQTTAKGAMVFGMTSGPELVAVATWPNAAQASSVRLILRDPAKAADAVIDPRRTDLAGRAPPRSVTQVFLAQSIGPAPASLAPPGAPRPNQAGVMVSFPPQAAEALAALDPRESATVEFVFSTRTGERVETAFIDVGDFAAGRAFLSAGR